MKARHAAKKNQSTTIDATTQTETQDNVKDAATQTETQTNPQLVTDSDIKSIYGTSAEAVATKYGILQKFRNIGDSESDGIYTLRLKECVFMGSTRTYSVTAKSIILDPEVFLDGSSKLVE